MIGQTFSSLLVIGLSERTHKNRPRYACRCVCGKEFSVDHYHLLSGHTKSCGCQRTKRINEFNRTHGLARTPEYRAWSLMRARCQCVTDKRYHYYGGRGIKIAPEWSDFEAFLNDMGRRPSSAHSLDRIDVNGDYTPDNCRWATWEEQQNNRRSTIILEHNGVAKSVTQWARHLGIPQSTLQRRLKNGRTLAEVINSASG